MAGGACCQRRSHLVLTCGGDGSPVLPSVRGNHERQIGGEYQGSRVSSTKTMSGLYSETPPQRKLDELLKSFRRGAPPISPCNNDGRYE